MHWLVRLFPQLHRRRAEAELDDEIRLHLELEAERRVNAGMTPRDAARAARIRLGNRTVIREDTRAVWGWRWMEDLWQDLRIAGRVMTRNPGFSGVAVFVLALGIGVNSAVFALVETLLLRPLPGVPSSELVGVYDRDTQPPGGYRPFSYPNYRDLRDGATRFSHLAAHTMTAVGVTEGDVTRRVLADIVSANYFETFGVEPAIGRTFIVEEERPGAQIPVVIVSDDYWTARGRTSAILGETLRVNGTLCTIAGVAPPDFTGSSIIGPELWLPFGMYEVAADYGPLRGPALEGTTRRLADRDHYNLVVVGRLASGASPDQVSADVARSADSLAAAFPAENANRTFTTAPLPRLSISTNPQNDRAELAWLSVVIFGLSATVLLVACLNLANLFLARGLARGRELAIRRALGGGRSRLVRQLLTEGFVLSVAGGGLGLALGPWATNLLMVSVAPLIPIGLHLPEVDHGGNLVLATLVFVVAATMLFAFGPAVRLANVDPARGLRRDDVSAGAWTGRRILATGNLLIIGQLALSLALLTAGGLFLRVSLAAATLDPGFDMRRGIVAELDPSLAGFDERQTRELYRTVMARLRALAGVEAVGAASLIPFGAETISRNVTSSASTSGNGGSDRISAVYYVVSRGYFSALGVPLLRGRDFTEVEMSSGAAPVAIIDDTLARQLFGDTDPIGANVQFINLDTRQPDTPMQVVGVVPARRHESFSPGLRPHIYVPLGQDYDPNLHVHLRLADDRQEFAATMLRTVRDELRRIDAQMPVVALRTLERHRAESLDLWLLGAGARLFGAFGVLALLVAVIGLYGVKAYLVSRRTQEVGIRMAIGATPGQVVWLMLSDGARVTAIGLAVGLALAIGTARVLGGIFSDLWSQVGPFDPIVFLAAPLLLAVTALVASYLPARRAAKVDPMVALRTE